MRKLLTAAALMAIGFAPAQNIDEIVNKHIEAVGGRENWNKIKSMRMECTTKIQGSEIKVTIHQIDKVASRQDVEVMGMTGYSILTPKEGWAYMPFQGHTKAERMTEEQVKTSQDDLSLKDEFITYTEMGKKIEYLGKDDIDGMECHKIKMIDKNGTETTYYMDTESLYVIRQVRKVKVDGQEQEHTTSFSNFEKLNEGIVYPMAIASGWGVAEIVKLEINPKIDENIFKVSEPQK